VELEWRETWPEEAVENDFVAVDNGLTVGRVKRAMRATGVPGSWSWSGTFYEKREDGTDFAPRGLCEGRREAMVALEDTYNRWRAVREIDPGRQA